MLFSVIVPIYKIEKYLRRCIDSVLGQTFSDFELILVNDGSPDNCPAICEEYAAKDKRIRVIHKENGGLVSARQAGVTVATGEYVFYVDGDDAICPEALESASEIIGQSHPDMVCFSYKRCVDGVIEETVHDLAEEGLYDKAAMKKHLYPKLLSDNHMKNLFYFVWGKALRRDLVTKHQLRVNPAICLGEDLSCTTPCYLEADTVYMSKKPVYLYTIRTDSLSTNFKTQQITQIADTVAGLRKLELSAPDDFSEQISRYACFMCFAILASAAEGKHFRSKKELKKLIVSSQLWEEIKKARFEKITIKSRIAIGLMKKKQIGPAFDFLYLCKLLKSMRKGGRA